MNLYKNNNLDSNVAYYEYGVDYISVKFKNTAKTYTYTYSSAGEVNVEKMKSLADRGSGLNSYINLNVKFNYQR